MYELCSDGSNFTIFAHNDGLFLVTSDLEEYEAGWNYDMLKLISTLGDLDASALGFILAGGPFFRAGAPM